MFASSAVLYTILDPTHAIHSQVYAWLSIHTIEYKHSGVYIRWTIEKEQCLLSAGTMALPIISN